MLYDLTHIYIHFQRKCYIYKKYLIPFFLENLIICNFYTRYFIVFLTVRQTYSNNYKKLSLSK